MGIFDYFKKKESEVLVGTVSFVTSENGDRYLHINQFKSFLEEYKSGTTNISQLELLNQIIGVLNDANNKKR